MRYFINRLFQTKNSWSHNFQQRLELGVKELGYDGDVVFYPKEKIVDKTNHLFSDLMEYGVQSAHALLYEKTLCKLNGSDKIIFMDPMQNPFGQLLLIDVDVPYEVFIHVSRNAATFAHSGFYYNYMEKFDSIIGATYSGIRGYVNDSNISRVIGAPLDDYKYYDKEKHTVLWAGNSLNKVKGFDELLVIADNWGNMRFIAYINKSDVEYANNLISREKIHNIIIKESVPANEFIKEAKKCKFVLSTSYSDSFGFGVFDSMAVGCIPIARNVDSYAEILPKEYLYDHWRHINFNTLEQSKSLPEIVEHYNYRKFAERLLEK